MSYYDRQSAEHLDGTRIFQSQEDRQNEASIAALVETRWKCSVKSFGALSPVDWYAVRDGRLIGLVELKSRTHEAGRYATVFLNVRKWLALTIGAVGLGVPAMFIVKFTDANKWIAISDVKAAEVKIGGTMRIVKSTNDIEPVIEVPVAAMKDL